MIDGVWVPKKLTAENGAKKALYGEFEETVVMDCPDCKGAGHIHEINCEECNRAGQYTIWLPVSWTNIKDIWEKGIDTVGIDAVDVHQVMEQALTFVRAVQTMNRTRYEKVYPHGDDNDPCYWQTQEWVNWIMELSNELDQSLTQLIKQKNSSMIQTEIKTTDATGQKQVSKSEL